MARHPATYIANFFVDMARYDDNDTITNMRINKLLYYAQAWSLVRNKKPLFDEDFEAWDYGPVVPSVYKKYKRFKKNNIDVLDKDYSVNDISENDLDALLGSYSYFNQFSTSKLVNATHRKGSPWSKAYSKGQSSKIDKTSISSSFTIPNDINVFHVNCSYGRNSKRWGAIGEDMPGLFAEEDTLEELKKECYLCADDLIEKDDTEHRPFILSFDIGPEDDD